MITTQNTTGRRRRSGASDPRGEGSGSGDLGGVYRLTAADR